MALPADRVLTLPLGSDASLRRRYMLLDEDLPANVRFGSILEVLDKLAEECALDYECLTKPPRGRARAAGRARRATRGDA